MSIVALLALLVCLPLWITDGVFLTEVLLGLRARPAKPVRPPEGSIAVIVPAHNEEGVIRQSGATMIARAPAGTRVLVVAHNCADATAAEALAGGAQVARIDAPEQRGKGYALAGGRAALAADPPAIVVMIDADCEPEEGAIARLARTAERTGKPVQANYLFRPSPGASVVIQISNFAMLVKNLVRQRGGRRIGAPAVLTGSGMAMPWDLFAGLDLATGNIVEDLAMGVELVRRDHRPEFQELATVWTAPSSVAGTQTQRARWEGGFVGTAKAIGLPLLGEGLRKLDFDRVWMGLHLLTAPLTLLLAMNVAVAGLWLLLMLLGAPGFGFVIALGLLVALLGAVLAAWALAGRMMLSGGALLRLPAYVLWKFALYARIAKGEKPAWIRTERID